MKISPINYNVLNLNNNTVFRSNRGSASAPSNERPKKADFFEACNYAYSNMLFNKKYRKNEFPASFLFQRGKVKKEDFDNLSNEDKKLLVEKAKAYVEHYKPKRHFASPKTVAKSACLLNEYFNKKYGTDGYRVISIGTSPAPVTQAMEYIDSNIIYLPVSGLHSRMCPPDNQKDYYIEKFPNMKLLMEFLDKKNVTDGKANILLDYCIDRHTLKTMQMSMESYFGFKEDELFSSDIVDLIDYIDYRCESRFNLSEDEAEELDGMMAYQNSERIVNVPHFNILDSLNLGLDDSIYRGMKSNETVYKKFDEFSTPLARAYSVCLLDELEKLQ